MKKLLTIACLFLIIAASVLAIRIYRSPVSDGDLPSLEFAAFPLNQPVYIDFASYPGETGSGNAAQFREASYWNGYSKESDGRREQTDQWLDWLLMTVLSSSNLRSNEINASLKDLPPSRRSVLQAVGNFEFGSTRSRAVRDGQVIALLPTGPSEERKARLADVADEQRKNLGQVPSCFYVFEYSIDPERQVATVVRRNIVEGRDLFSPSSGYHERTLEKLDDLKQLMSEINDVTYARVEGSLLHVGGRVVPNYRGIGVEEVATIWQSEKSGLEGLHGSGFSLDPSFDPIAVKRNIEPLMTILSNLFRVAGLAADDAPEHSTSSVTSEFPQVKKYDGSPDISALLEQLTKPKSEESPTTDRAKIRHKLEEGNFDPYLDAAIYACDRTQQANECKGVLSSIAIALRIQKARYDGTLKGTEVGMTLFYTDLLMKLWSFDFQGSTPRAGQVTDFPNKVDMHTSSVYVSEANRLTATRLWLGSLDKGFQIGPNRTDFLLGRITTRVFAVPSDFLENKDVSGVTEPQIYNRIFIAWWNQHYEEVARYEKEYQRLNEIMKWSQIVGWLNSSDRGDVLDFVGRLDTCVNSAEKDCIKRDNWFPDWLKRHDAELTYHCWPFSATTSTCPRSAESEARGLPDENFKVRAFGTDTILHVKAEPADALHFYPKNYAAIDVETLPLLKSTWFIELGGERTPGYKLTLFDRAQALFNDSGRLTVGFLSGGVSLAERESIQARSALTEDVPPAVRGGNVNYAESEAAAGRFRTLDKVEIQLSQELDGGGSVVLRPDSSARLRSLIGEFRNGSFETTFDRRSGNVIFAMKSGDAPLGDLRIRPTNGGFHVGWVSRDVDTAQILARKVSQSESAEAVLDGNSSVSMHIKIGQDTYLVKPSNSDRWIKMQVGASDDSAVPANFDARIAGFGPDSKSVDIAILSDKQAISQIPSAGFVDIHGNNAAVIVSKLPDGLQTKTVHYLGQSVTLETDANGHVFASVSELPEDLRISPEKLRRLARESTDSHGLNESAVERSDSGNFRSLANQLVSDPKSVRQVLDSEVRQQLRDYDELALGSPLDARERLDQMVLEFGDLPEISLRRALSELETGNAESAVRALTQVDGRAVGDNQQFFDEINRRIALSAGADKESLRQFGGYADWQLSTTHQPHTAQLLAKAQDKHFYTEFRVSSLRADGADSSVWSETTPKIFYIQDSPGLNNIDPYSPSGQIALQSLVQSGQVSLEKAAAVDLAHYRPGVVVEMDSGRSLRLAEVPIPRPIHVPTPQNQGCGADNDGDDCTRVYVIALPHSRS